MKRFYLFGVLIMIAVVHTNSAEQVVVECAKPLIPIVRNPPQFPDYTDINYEGYAEVEFIVDIEGNVRESKILNSKWERRRTGRKIRKGPEVGDYERAIVHAIENWKYAKQSLPCKSNSVIQMRHGN